MAAGNICFPLAATTQSIQADINGQRPLTLLWPKQQLSRKARLAVLPGLVSGLPDTVLFTAGCRIGYNIKLPDIARFRLFCSDYFVGQAYLQSPAVACFLVRRFVTKYLLGEFCREMLPVLENCFFPENISAPRRNHKRVTLFAVICRSYLEAQEPEFSVGPDYIIPDFFKLLSISSPVLVLV